MKATQGYCRSSYTFKESLESFTERTIEREREKTRDNYENLDRSTEQGYNSLEDGSCCFGLRTYPEEHLA